MTLVLGPSLEVVPTTSATFSADREYSTACYCVALKALKFSSSLFHGFLEFMQYNFHDRSRWSDQAASDRY